MAWSSRSRFALLALAIFALPLAATAQVQDNANVFSPEAEKEATAAIEQMKQKYQRTMLIETYASVPAEMQAEVKSSGGKAAVAKWADERLRSTPNAAVALLVSLNPKSFALRHSTSQAGSLFTQTDANAMLPRIEEALRGGNFDAVAGTAASSVLVRMGQNAASGGTAAAATPGRSAQGGQPAGKPADAQGSTLGFGWGTWLCVGAALIGGFMLIRGFMRSRQQGPAGPYGPQGYGPGQQGYGQPGQPGYGQPQQGGGFGRGLAGGLLGGVAGSFIGHQLFGQGGSSAQAGEAPPPADAPAADPGAQEFGGGGGDFGDAGGGGGDFGGGGGDF